MSLTSTKKTDNTGRMMTLRVKAADRTSVMLTYSTTDANAIRAFVHSIRLKGTKAPSQSLIARRSLQVYLLRLEQLRRDRPDQFAAEVAELERMVTPVPSPALTSKKRQQ